MTPLTDPPTTDCPWQAAWISQSWTRDAHPVGGHPIAFRKDWTVTDAAGAVIRICAFPRYALFVNGKVVGYGPARSFPESVHYDTWDLERHFRPGTNAIAVIVSPCFGGSGYAPISRLGLIAEAVTTSGELSVTDETWRARDADWIADTSLLISLPIGPQEHFDARKEPSGWKTAEPGDGWSDAFVLGPVGTPPWRSLTARPLPPLVEAAFDAPLVWQGTGPSEPVPVGENIARAFNAAELTEETLSRGGSIGSKGGDVFAFDFGRTRLVRPALFIAEASADVRLEYFYSNGLGDRPMADCGFGSAQEGAADSFIPESSAESSWEALVPRGMRFLTVRVAGTGKCRFQLSAKTVDYPFPPIKPLGTDDAVLQRIWDVSADTLRSSTNDVHVDTCGRENSLWTLDACVTGEAAYHTFGETASWRRCLDLIGQGIDERGFPKAVVPAETSFMCLVDQTHVWAMSCADYLNATDDEPLAHIVVEPMRRLITMCGELITPDGFYAPPPHSWHWIDWAPIDKRPYSLPANALLALACDAAMRVGQIAGDDSLIDVAAGLRESLATRLATFYDDAVGAFRTRIEPDMPPRHVARMMGNDEAITHGVHANVLAVRAEIGTDAQRRSAIAFVAARLREPLGPVNQFGPGWTNLLLDPLFDYGQGDIALDFVARVYGQSLDVGAPTWGEGFGPSKHNSAHGWGAAVNTLLAKRVGLVG